MSPFSEGLQKKLEVARLTGPYHVCTPETCPPGNYYLFAEDGEEMWLMSGPYPSHQDAKADLQRAVTAAGETDGRIWRLMYWGELSMPDEYGEPGELNRNGNLPRYFTNTPRSS